MSSKVSGGKPAKVQDVDEDSGKPVPGTSKFATAGAKQSSSFKETRNAGDTKSDSGYSSYTYGTLGSADSAKVIPKTGDASPKSTTKETASTAATPTPVQPHAKSPSKTSRSESPTREHRKSESKSFKKAAGPATSSGHVCSDLHCNNPECRRKFEQLYPQGYVAVSGPAYQSRPYYVAPPEDCQPEQYYPTFDPAYAPPPLSSSYEYPPPAYRSRRSSSRAHRPMSLHDPNISEPYWTNEALVAPPSAGYIGYYRPEYFDAAPASLPYTEDPFAHPGAIDVPSIRQSVLPPQAASRPRPRHAHTDSVYARRYSAIEPGMVADFAANTDSGYSDSLARRASSRRRGSRSSSRHPAEQEFLRHPNYDYEYPTYGEGSMPPPSYVPARRPSIRHSVTEPSPSLGRSSSKASHGRSHTEFEQAIDDPGDPAAYDYEPARPSHRHSVSHSRRASQAAELSGRRSSLRPSVSPGVANIISESRSGRRSEYLSEENRQRQARRQSRDLSYEPGPDRTTRTAATESAAEEYMSQSRGGVLDDEIASRLREAYTDPTRQAALPSRKQPSVSSRHSTRSHKSHNRHSLDTGSTSSRRDSNVVVRVSEGGHSYDIPIPEGANVQFVVKETVPEQRPREAHSEKRSDKHTEKQHSSASSIKSFFSRAGSSRSRASSDIGTDTRESRRRSRIGSPILEDRRGERREERREKR